MQDWLRCIEHGRMRYEFRLFSVLTTDRTSLLQTAQRDPEKLGLLETALSEVYP
jgi:hypothetical protein